MGIQNGHLVLERGFGSDCDESIRSEISSITGSALLDENSQEVVDAVITWWREDDGDLIDELVDCLTYLSESGPIWLLTPKVSRPGHVDSLSSYKGKKNVVLVFFPFAFTGTCTGELCALRDDLSAFQNENIELLAISCDAMFTQKVFAEK
ncbi:MAG: DUF3052 family protein, partial [Actinobacteria bacterium]|nr:DUF3052 family protein [Actinomycetota bacterium]